jgi:hypothetical protein
MRIKKIFVFTALLSSLTILTSWGDLGHTKISRQAASSFKGKMKMFSNFADFIVEHSSDADYRKSSDKNEGPKHYIDIDNYEEFVATGKISQSLEENIILHGEEFVKKNGYLPWATKTAYDSLVCCLRRYDFEKAKIFASDLGHYVADGHMPLHISKNYDGQLTDNKGIHSRYETEMVNKYIDEIDYKIKKVKFIDDVENFIFDYLYENYTYIDLIIEADNYAKSLANSTIGEEYLAALWLKTGQITTELFKNASQNLANLYFTAWMEAGKPKI